jgi:hypothetical protein
MKALGTGLTEDRTKIEMEDPEEDSKDKANQKGDLMILRNQHQVVCL